MNSDSVSRAALSAGVWFGTAFALSVVLGANLPVTDLAVDAGLMGASALGADVLHGALGWVPTGVTSAAATGAMYAAAQKAYRAEGKGGDNYIINFVAAAANALAVEYVTGAMNQ